MVLLFTQLIPDRSLHQRLATSRTYVPVVFLLTLLVCYSAGLMAQGRVTSRVLNPDAGLLVILLGTGITIPNPERASACTAVIAGDRIFLIDTNERFFRNTIYSRHERSLLRPYNCLPRWHGSVTLRLG